MSRLWPTHMDNHQNTLFKFQQYIMNKKPSKNPVPPKKGPPSVQEKDKQSIISEDLPPPQQQGSEAVKVALRIRPMNQLETSRNDTMIVSQENQKTVQINHKDTHKNFRFNTVLGEKYSQANVFQECNVEEFIDSALQGYSATIFAYGQTGSGKTYTMAGREEIFSSDVYHTSESEGIIPRAIRCLWGKVAKHQQKLSVKASYTEIYNQQVRDLLNLSSGVLHCRYNVSSGFFVQNLIVVDCTNVDDMISVLHEGMKNRKSASHQLNKDSSRSHSILTMYLITEIESNGQNVKKYGKLSFVDLAGSERLKESKSQGEMIKETGNINKSLFTLGKVIKCLSDKKNKAPYIPYRDSKLTMLLMDSLGGASKALMIACASPSSAYFDETLSTLNYATRTMNIKNKPVVQMDQKDQNIVMLQMEIEELRKHNNYLRQQFQRVSKGQPLLLPSSPSKTVDSKINLPYIDKIDRNEKSQKGTIRTQDRLKSTDSVIMKYQSRFQELKMENEQIRRQRENSQSLYQMIMNNNLDLQTKLQNLQEIFLNKKKKDQKLNYEIVTTNLIQENTDLKHRLLEVEKLKREMEYKGMEQSTGNVSYQEELREENQVLQEQIEQLQRREKELLDLFTTKNKK